MRLRHVNFKAEAESFVARRHQALELSWAQPFLKVKDRAKRAPCCLQFCAQDANHAFHNAFFDFGNVALDVVHAADSTEQEDQ